MLYFDKVELAWAAMALAVLTKPQGAVLVPLIGLASLLAYPARRLLLAAGLSVAVTVLVLLPWTLAGRVADVAAIYRNTVDTYPFCTLNANIWALVEAVNYPQFSIGSGDPNEDFLFKDSELVSWLSLVTYKQLGLILLLQLPLRADLYLQATRLGHALHRVRIRLLRLLHAAHSDHREVPLPGLSVVSAGLAARPHRARDLRRCVTFLHAESRIRSSPLRM